MRAFPGEPDAPSILEWFGREYIDPYYAGAAACMGLIQMAEAIKARPLHRCVSCGFDGQADHPNDYYDRCLYRKKATRDWYCGECSDQLGIDEDLIFDPCAPPKRGKERV